MPLSHSSRPPRRGEWARGARMPHPHWAPLLLLLLIHCLVATAVEAAPRALERGGRFGAVATGHPEATAAALKILARGGNAVDAAVAAAFVLGVVDPSNSGLGGDGFALLHLPGGGLEAWDASIQPPLADKGGAHPEGSAGGPRSRVAGRAPSGRRGPIPPLVGVGSDLGLPTEPALLLTLLQRHGTLSLPELVAPAVRLASRGFRISSYLESVLDRNLMRFGDRLALATFAPHGRPLRAGEKLVQRELAATLSAIARDGGRSFYRGTLAAALAKDFHRRGSRYTAADLAACSPREVLPQRLTIGRWELAGTPPPSAAVVVMGLVEALSDPAFPELTTGPGLNAALPILRRGFQIKYDHLAECLRNPRRYLALLRAGSPASAVDTQSPGRASSRRLRPRASRENPPAPPEQETTHLVTWDRNGMVVSMTLTLGRHFGTLQFSPLGFFYNNEMHNYTSLVARYPRDYPPTAGPISAKAPLFILENGRPILAIGGAGANRIVSNLALIIVRFLRGGHTLAELVHAPRLSIDKPGSLVVEWAPASAPLAIPPAEIGKPEILAAGADFFGLVSAVSRTGSRLTAVGDYRRDGSAGALTRDPEAPRSFVLDAIAWRKRGLDQLSIAEVIPSPRQTVSGWRHIGTELDEDPESPTPRRRLTFPGTASAVLLRQVVTITPNAPAPAPPGLESPERWRHPLQLGPRQRAFLDRIPPDLHGRDLVNWLLVEIGFGIPYKLTPGRTTGEELLELGLGDCSGKARLFRDLARARGLPCRLVGGVILKEGVQEITHIWDEVFLDGRWHTVCPTNLVFGRLPSGWLIMRYGDTLTLGTPARLMFRVHERVVVSKASGKTRPRPRNRRRSRVAP